MAVTRFLGTVIGNSPNTSDSSIKVTIQLGDADTSGQFSLKFLSPAQAALLPVGQAIFIDITPSSADETAIAGATTVVPADTLN